MSSVPDWLLIITGLGGGAIGSVITTYGTQAKERRAARSELLALLARADRLAGQPDSQRAERHDAARAVVNAALLAGIPVHIADTYLVAYDAVRAPSLSWAPTQNTPRDPSSVGLHAYRQAVALMQLTIWHPVLSRLTRRHHSQHILRFLRAVLPPDAEIWVGRRTGIRKWERAAIQAAKGRHGNKEAPK